MPWTTAQPRLLSVFDNQQRLPLHYTGLILGLRLANERRRYFVTTSLIGWAQAQILGLRLANEIQRYFVNTSLNGWVQA